MREHINLVENFINQTFLAEKPFDISVSGRRGVKSLISILMDPTENELVSFIIHTSQSKVRGLIDVDSGTVYFWDAFTATHIGVSNALKIRGEVIGFFIVKSKTSNQYLIKLYDYDSLLIKDCEANKRIQSLMKKGRIIIDPSDIIMESTINEKIENIEFKHFRRGKFTAEVAVNPNENELLAFIEKSKYKSLRGILDKNDIYFWDADVAIHDDMQYSLGTEPPFATFEVVRSRRERGVYFIRSYGSSESIQRLAVNNRNIQHILKSGKIKISNIDDTFESRLNEKHLKTEVQALTGNETL